MIRNALYQSHKFFQQFFLRRVGFVVSFAALITICFSCANEIEKVKIYTVPEEQPSIKAEGYEMLFSDSTVIRFKLQTPELIRHDNRKEPYTEFPKGVKIIKYDSNMNIISSITAQFAKRFDSDDRWEAKNNVIAVNLKGDTLKTEYLVWDMKQEKIYSDQFVRIIQKDKTYTGVGFESNQDFSSYKIKELKGVIYVDVQEK